MTLMSDDDKCQNFVFISPRYTIAFELLRIRFILSAVFAVLLFCTAGLLYRAVRATLVLFFFFFDLNRSF